MSALPILIASGLLSAGGSSPPANYHVHEVVEAVAADGRVLARFTTDDNRMPGEAGGFVEKQSALPSSPQDPADSARKHRPVMVGLRSFWNLRAVSDGEAVLSLHIDNSRLVDGKPNSVSASHIISTVTAPLGVEQILKFDSKPASQLSFPGMAVSYEKVSYRVQVTVKPLA